MEGSGQSEVPNQAPRDSRRDLGAGRRKHGLKSGEGSRRAALGLQVQARPRPRREGSEVSAQTEPRAGGAPSALRPRPGSLLYGCCAFTLPQKPGLGDPERPILVKATPRRQQPLLSAVGRGAHAPPCCRSPWTKSSPTAISARAFLLAATRGGVGVGGWNLSRSGTPYT